MPEPAGHWKIVRVYEGQEVPVGVEIIHLIATENEPQWGTTSSRRVYILAVRDPDNLVYMANGWLAGTRLAGER